ncbi:MAG TPA: PKD domain-containing protein, partial [Thermoanaerobaculia bacterium]
MIVARPSKGRQARDFGFFIAAFVLVIAAAPARQTKPLQANGAAEPLPRMPYAASSVEGRPGSARVVTITVSPSANQPRDDASLPPPARPVRAIPRAALPAEARRTAVVPSIASGLPVRPAAANVSASDLVVFTDTTISIPLANRNNQTPEPSLAVNGDVIFSTGNHYAQLSTDGGAAFSFLDPATAFPPAKGGFCCDQRTIYAASRDLLVWTLQYASDVNGNIVRIAVSRGQTNQSSRVFSYFDLTPQSLRGGFPPGFVLDVTDLGVSDNFLYLSGDVFSSSLASSAFVASVVIRFSLDDLAAGQFASWDLFTLTDVGQLKPVQGANDTMFFLTHPATSAVRLLMLPESSSVLSFVDVAVTPYSDGAGRYAFCPDPNGVNPCGGADDRIAAAWRSASRGEIGVMWNAAQNGAHPFPYVQAAVLRASDGALLSEAVIGSPQTAWQYPSAAVNARGDVAGTMSVVGPQTFLGSVIWISDGVNGHSLSPLESELVVAGSQSPSANRWGDFFTTRVHSTLTNLWTTMAVAETQEAGGPEPHYVLFGRSSDGPASSTLKPNFIYSPTNPLAGQTVTFRDLSLGAPASWSWDFGDGKSSTDENPIHVFSTASSYDVALTVTGSGGGSDVIMKTIVVLP